MNAEIIQKWLSSNSSVSRSFTLTLPIREQPSLCPLLCSWGHTGARLFWISDLSQLWSQLSTTKWEISPSPSTCHLPLNSSSRRRNQHIKSLNRGGGTPLPYAQLTATSHLQDRNNIKDNFHLHNGYGSEKALPLDASVQEKENHLIITWFRFYSFNDLCIGGGGWTNLALFLSLRTFLPT